MRRRSGRSPTAAPIPHRAPSRTRACRWLPSGTSTTTVAQIHHRRSQSGVDRHARRRQHAAAHPAHQLRQQERPVQPGAAGARRSARRLDGVVGVYYFDEDSFDRLLVPLGNPGTSYDTQRVCDGRRLRGRLHGMDVQIHRCIQRDRGCALHGRRPRDCRRPCSTWRPRPRAEPPAPTALCPFAGPPPTQTGCLFLTTNRFEREFSATTKSASVQYRFNPSVMTYASWSEGFKSGGFNQRYNAAPPGNAPISFDPKPPSPSSWVSSWIPPTCLRINVAVFTTDYDDIQMTYRLASCRCCSTRASRLSMARNSSSIRADAGFPARRAASDTWMRSSTASRRHRRSAR